MKINRFLIIILLLAHLQLSVRAQQNWDYSSDQSYKNPDFLRDSDPTKWNYKNVDWSNSVVFENPRIYDIDNLYSNPEVYNNPTFYKNLPEYKYKNLDYKIVNFQMIEDHSKIIGDKYLSDLGCKFCRLNFQGLGIEKDTLKFNSEGIKHKKGDYVTIQEIISLKFLL